MRLKFWWSTRRPFCSLCFRWCGTKPARSRTCIFQAGYCRTGFWLRCMPPPGAPAASGSVIPMVLAVVTGVAVAFAVWLTGHALDILALLSPIPLLDVFFKACRVAIFLTVGVLAVLNSRVALLVSLVVIGVCFLCFWWALRLAVFGAVFAWDILRSRLFGRRRDPSLDGEVSGSRPTRLAVCAREASAPSGLPPTDRSSSPTGRLALDFAAP